MHFLKTAVRSNLNNRKKNKFLTNYYNVLLHAIVHKVTPDSWTEESKGAIYWDKMSVFKGYDGLDVSVSVFNSTIWSLNPILPYLPTKIKAKPLKSIFRSRKNFLEIKKSFYSVGNLGFAISKSLKYGFNQESTLQTTDTQFSKYVNGVDGALGLCLQLKKNKNQKILYKKKISTLLTSAMNSIVIRSKGALTKKKQLNLNFSSIVLDNFDEAPFLSSLKSERLLETYNLKTAAGFLSNDTITKVLSWLSKRTESPWLPKIDVPRLGDHSSYIKLRHFGVPYRHGPYIKTKANQLKRTNSRIEVGAWTPSSILPSFNVAKGLLKTLKKNWAFSKVFNRVKFYKIKNPKPSTSLIFWESPKLTNRKRVLIGLGTITDSLFGVERFKQPVDFLFFNRFWLYYASGLNDLVFKFFNKRFKHFTFLLAKYEKAFRMHFHIQTITRLNQYFLSFFLTKNITFKNHKKIINSNIIVSYIQPHKRIYTSLKFLKLFLTFKRQEFFSSRVYFLVKYAFFNEKSFVNTYISQLYSAFNKNLSNKVIKAPESSYIIKIDEDVFYGVIDNHRAEPITEAVAAALELRRDYIKKVKKLRRERMYMKEIRKN